MTINIAIDGPSGAGKSTLSRALSKELGYIYVDTGALYRTVGLYVYNNNVSVSDQQAVEKCLHDINLDIDYVDDEQRMLLNGQDVSADIRKHIISDYASKVSAIPAVRTFLFDTQRELAERNNVVMDGRDIGSVVLPNAQVKIYLTASAQVRAQRRFDELIAKGYTDLSYKKILDDVIERDNRDMSRSVSPLKIADGVIVVDTTQLDFNESLEKLLNVVKEKIK